jgi:hypothetical protein
MGLFFFFYRITLGGRDRAGLEKKNKTTARKKPFKNRQEMVTNVFDVCLDSLASSFDLCVWLITT